MESLGASRNGSGSPLAVLARQWAPNGFDLLAFCLLMLGCNEWFYTVQTED